MDANYTAQEWLNLLRNRNPAMRPFWEHRAHETVDRALSLLAAVESSGDAIVRELRDCENACRVNGLNVVADIYGNAAARITLDAQENAALKAEIVSVKAENARLRVDANKGWPYANGEVANQLKTWQRLAFELSQSIVALSVVKDGVTFFQKDPIKDQETFHLWLRLNDAQTAVLNAYRRSLALRTEAGRMGQQA